MSILSFLTTYSGSAGATAVPVAAAVIPETAGFEVVTDTGVVRASVTQVTALLLPGIFAAITNVSPTELPAASIYQRTTRTGGAYGAGAASVAFNIMVSIAGLPLYFRLRDATAAGNPIIVASSTALTATAAGMQTVSISVPCGPYWYLVDWCAGTGGAWILGTHKIGVGEVLAVAGQSLGDRLMHDFSGVAMASIGLTPPVLHSAFMTWADSGGSGVAPAAVSWAAVADGLPLDSAFAPQLARRFLSASGVPVAVIGYAHGGTSIASWQPGQADYLALKAVLAAAGTSFGSLLWFQGHSDAQANTSTLSYIASLTTLVNQIKSDFPTSAGMKILISTIPDIYSNVWGTAGQIDAIRQAGIGYAAANSAFASHVTPLDLELTSDGTHQDQAGNAGMADHVFRAMRGAFGQDPAGDAGPYLTGVGSRASGSAVIKLTVAQVGGTGLVAVPNLPAVSSQFQVFGAGLSTSPYVISSVALVSATEIDITLAAVPSDSVALGVRYRLAPDGSMAVTSAGIYDNNTADGLPRGRQLQMYVGEITVQAPGGTATAIVATVPILNGVGSGGGGVAPIPLGFFKADVLTGVSGSAIALVSDATGNGHGLVAAGGGPTLLASGVNGLNVARFVAGQSLTNSSGATWMTNLQGSFTMLAVFELPSTSTQVVPVSAGQNSGSNSNAFYMLTSGSSGGPLQFMRQNSAGTVSGPPFAGALSPGTLVKAIARFNSGTGLATLNVNGTRVATTIAVPDSGAAAWNFFNINNYQVGSFSGPFTWCETAVWNGLASDSDELALLSYASAKWGG